MNTFLPPVSNKYNAEGHHTQWLSQTVSQRNKQEESTIPTYKTLRMIKEFDCVELTEAVNTIKELVKFNPLENPVNRLYTPILEEYVLKFHTDMSAVPSSLGKMAQVIKDTGATKVITYVYFKGEENIMECYSFEPVTGLYYLVFSIDGAVGEGESPFKYMNSSTNEKECYIVLSQIMAVVSYIAHKMTETKTVIKADRLPRAAGQNRAATIAAAKPQKRTVKILNEDKVVYTVKSSQPNVVNRFRKYQRHAGSWSVAGHPRKLKSGKIVWVKPHTKGEGAKTPKTYKVK